MTIEKRYKEKNRVGKSWYYKRNKSSGLYCNVKHLAFLIDPKKSVR